MNKLEKKSKNQQTMIIKTFSFGEKTEQYYRQYKQDAFQQPQLVMYQLLRSIIRKQIRQPFQFIKSLASQSHQEDQVEINRISKRHSKYELEVVEENIINVVSSVNQRLIIQAFIAVKNVYANKLRIEEAYYNEDNLQAISNCFNFVISSWKSHTKWEVFSKISQIYKESKHSLSHTQYNSQKQVQIQALNSYIIQNKGEQQDKSISIIRRTKKEGRKTLQHKPIKQYQSIQSHLQQRHHKKQTNNHPISYQDSEDLQSKIFVTQQKTTHKQQQQSQHLKEYHNHVFLIQDYRVKPRAPTNFIKIPVNSQNTNIVQVQTGRKTSKKKRIVRQEQQIQKQICSDCKYCIQMRQRKQILKVVEQRLRKQLVVGFNQ